MTLATTTLAGVELRYVRLPLTRPFRTSFGTVSIRDALLVRAITTDGDGWGECVALPEPIYSAEYVEGAANVIRQHLAPRLLRARAFCAEDVRSLLGAVVGHPMAKAALEMAVLDAHLRAQEVSFAHYLGATRDAIDCGVSVGIMGTIDELLGVVGEHLRDGYRRIKLKIEPGWDVEPVRAVRERFGGVPLQVDANCAYRPADSAALKRLDEFGLVLIEQPFREDQLLAHADLARVMETPVCLDESITSVATAADAIALGACEIVNIKPGRVGGYLEARRIHDLCRDRGIAAWCGGMLETGLGRAGNVALAALPGFTLPGDISASERYYAHDLTEPFVMKDGRLVVPQGPGLGVSVLPDVLDEVTVRSEMVWGSQTTEQIKEEVGT